MKKILTILLLLFSAYFSVGQTLQTGEINNAIKPTGKGSLATPQDVNGGASYSYNIPVQTGGLGEAYVRIFIENGEGTISSSELETASFTVPTLPGTLYKVKDQSATNVVINVRWSTTEGVKYLVYRQEQYVPSITTSLCSSDIYSMFYVNIIADSFDVVNFTALNSGFCALVNDDKLQTFSFELGQENGGFGNEVGVNDEWTLEYKYSVDGGKTWTTADATSPEENPESSSITANKNGKITLTFKRIVDYINSTTSPANDYVFQIRLISITDGYGNKKILKSTDPKYNKTFTIHKLPETPIIIVD